jgi:hypothetical protein
MPRGLVHLTVSLTIVSVACYASHAWRKVRAQQVSARIARDVAAEQRVWQSAEYVPIEHAFHALSVADWVTPHDKQTRSSERAVLFPTITNALSYLASPTFQGYYALKTNDANYVLTRSRSISTLLSNNVVSLTDNKALYSNLYNAWTLVHSNNTRLHLCGLAAIAPSSLKIITARADSPLITTPLTTMCLFPVRSLDSGVRYREHFVTNQQEVITTLVYFYARFAPAHISGPICLIFTKRSKDIHWHFIRMVYDAQLTFSTVL